MIYINDDIFVFLSLYFRHVTYLSRVYVMFYDDVFVYKLRSSFGGTIHGDPQRLSGLFLCLNTGGGGDVL
jgi:hypothetical protein